MPRINYPFLRVEERQGEDRLAGQREEVRRQQIQALNEMYLRYLGEAVNKVSRASEDWEDD